MNVRDLITELLNQDMDKTVEIHIKLNDSEYEANSYEVKKSNWSDSVFLAVEETGKELIDSDELYDLRQALESAEEKIRDLEGS